MYSAKHYNLIGRNSYRTLVCIACKSRYYQFTTSTLLAELIRDGLSDISFSDGSMFAYDDVCD